VCFQSIFLSNFWSKYQLNFCKFYGGLTCRNPSFGLATKARGCNVAGQEEGSPGVKAKASQGCKPKGRKPGSEGKGIGRVRAKRKPGSHHILRGVNTHIPKTTPILGEGVPVDSRNFRGRVEGSNLNGLLRFLYR
jgi:hypothetical protein